MFLMNKYGSSPVTNIKEVILNFYESEEITAAKETLHAELVKLNMNDVPRLVRRQGDNRSARDVDDMLQYFNESGRRADSGAAEVCCCCS